MKTLIRNCVVWDGSGAAPFAAEVLIDGARIARVARGTAALPAEGAQAERARQMQLRFRSIDGQRAVITAQGFGMALLLAQQQAEQPQRSAMGRLALQKIPVGGNRLGRAVAGMQRDCGLQVVGIVRRQCGHGCRQPRRRGLRRSYKVWT